MSVGENDFCIQKKSRPKVGKRGRFPARGPNKLQALRAQTSGGFAKFGRAANLF